MTNSLKDTEYLYIGNYEFLKNIAKEKANDKEWSDLYDEFTNPNDDFNGFPQKNFTIYENSNPNQILQSTNNDKLVASFRKFGYRYADLNPLYPSNRKEDFLANISKDINKDDKIINKMSSCYLKTRSAEFEFVSDNEKYNWLVENFEKEFTLNDEEKKSALWHLMEAEGLEKFLHIKFPGAKRFSVEGGDASIAIFEAMMEEMGNLGCEEIVLGMAHRGRLNFFTKVCGESYGFLFGQFAGKNAFDFSLRMSGDVKYHLGTSCDRKLKNGEKLHLSLIPNPSHLEAVNPVVIGNVRAKQDFRNDKQKNKIVPFLVHGDASFAGQGIVYETLAMNNLPAYDVGGCIHLVIDNQVGFTANNNETRSTSYSSEIAKLIEAPIFHINGDDIESCIAIAKLVAQYRIKFGGDVVMNLVCYRRYGHNEGDEPFFTQPTMYKKIAEHPTPFNLYSKNLVEKNIVTQEIIKEKTLEFHDKLEKELENFQPKKSEDLLVGNWSDCKFNFDDSKLYKVKSGINPELVTKVIDCLKNIPSSITPNTKIKKLLEKRAEELEHNKEIDWGTGEMLAFASLLDSGTSIRISGEDVMRGTFAHRQSAIVDQNDDSRYYYYKSLGEKSGARFDVYNSILSEYGVMGFDYGYSLFSPKNLVIWEAQFGDFANGAQIILDQFLSGAEQKWGRLSNIVLMLPHGYEGQGPEHSSARIERYLQLCGQYNVRVINPTTPSNIFHALRRQIIDQDKKPLIIFTPKSLLRHKFAVSKLEEFYGETSFNETILFGQLEKSKKLLICSGKIYYDLYEKIINEKIEDVSILRIEQLYPFPIEDISKIIKSFVEPSKEKSITWCQDEPKNMGSYSFIYQQLDELLFELGVRIKYCGRNISAATATGSNYDHQKEQKKLIESCFI